MKSIALFFIAIILLFTLYSCKKYLDAKPDKSLQIPSSVADLQAIMDYGIYMNGYNGVSFGETSADNYYLSDDSYNQLSEESRNAYIWNNKNYSNFPNDWAFIYNVVNVANEVLDNIASIPATVQNQQAWNNAKGEALFFRSYSFLQGAFIFCKAYDENTASEDYGMSLRLTSDFNIPSTRSNLKDTYSQIITDLEESTILLPDLPVHDFRPSRASAYALLARTFLSMRKYDSCLKYAEMSLKIKSDLMDFNSLSVDDYFPFTRFNEEVLFDNTISQATYYDTDPYYARIDSILYNSYNENDLRKQLFFRQESTGYSFKGSYAGYTLFIGIATDEVYLMQAECNARLGNNDDALNDLNTLMEKRWRTGTFIPFTAATSQETLNIILQERRKELVFRNVRWMDIKRLNKDEANITLKRIVDGNTYTLPPNDNRFALPLPADIVKMTGMPQNQF